MFFPRDERFLRRRPRARQLRFEIRPAGEPLGWPFYVDLRGSVKGGRGIFG